MKCIRIILFVVLTSFFSGNIVAQYIQVTDNISAQDLVQNTLINSPCANVSNFSASGGNFGTGQGSFGYFTAGTSGFPFVNGIVLSTSKAVSTEGPNASTLSEDATGWGGDSDLEQALFISNTSNASVLEFDFVPFTSQVSFDYLFASEEYHGSAPCYYSDGFAFLLKVAGTTTYQNLALVPGTSTPVKVTTVHPDIPGSCPPINETYFGSNNGVSSPTNFNGQTVIMTAKAGVTPGTLYHIKLVIADQQDPLYDSAIFLGGGSFKVGTDLGPDKLIANNNPVCFGESYVIDATEAGTNTYKWYKNGVLQTQITPTYTVTDSGIYSVEINLGATTCIATGQVTIEYSPLPVLNDEVLVQCDDNNDGISIFNLTKLDNLIKNGSTTLSSVTYYESLINAQNQISPILNPTTYQNTTINHLFARVANTFGCANYANVNLVISNNVINPQTYSTCDLDANQDGLMTFDLNAMITPQIILAIPAGLIIEYYVSKSDAVLQINPLSNSFTNTIANQQIIYARIVNGSDCFGIIPITLNINAFNPPNFLAENRFFCKGDSIYLSVANGFSSYLWSNGAIGNIINVSIAGNYSVTVTDTNTCSKTKNFIVSSSEIATITSIDINDFSGNENTIRVNFLGNGAYEFSIDGINFQDSSIFTNVNIGEYYITIRDKNGCGDAVSNLIYVLDYPKYFTPNGDGINDFWRIKNLDNQAKSSVYIYDRFGKLIKEITANGNGWDGTFGGKLVPADDYWFYLILENNRIIKSHFALKR
jgi:gliding motility-associated-like protein